MRSLTPSTPEELAEGLAAAAAAGRRIRLGGAFSKSSMGGPISDADVCVSTQNLNRLRQYEPRDLTISVEAGMPWRELQNLLAENKQMLPLDPPFASQATVGGVVAANTSGPRRRQYGGVRDFVIGMTFATLEGKLIQTGGMVVKNVAGLDMGKLMIGSYGTLAAIATVNFKVIPAPARSLSFCRRFETVDEVFNARDEILRSVLQPSAIDILNPAAAERIGQEGWLLLLRAGGNAALLDRYARELSGFETIEGEAETALWQSIQEFTPAFLDDYPLGTVVRVSSSLQQMKLLAGTLSVPLVARAGTGVGYAHFTKPEEAGEWASRSKGQEWKCVIDFAPESHKEYLMLWPDPGPELATMQRIKQMFDPNNLLNKGRLHGRI
jgi:FAD/FMN-containing dehydrogenases